MPLPLGRAGSTAVGLEPLAEVERALLVVEVLHAPHPKALSLLLGLGEHVCTQKEEPGVRESREHIWKAGESCTHTAESSRVMICHNYRRKPHAL